jgi:tRNA pseudouridine55 synthase
MKRTGAAYKDIDGVLLLDKPAGPSSNQALQRVRRALMARKAGHAGTLDPLATGLLPILLGEATKFAGHLADAFKVYEATVLLGVKTTTGDLAGDVIERTPVDVTNERLHAVTRQFVGDFDQVPPMHSALKVGGRPLYERARRGETIERAARKVTVAELTIGALCGDEFDVRVRCSKGTYVRVLAEDIGQALGCAATLKRLRRTAVGSFTVDSAISLEALETGDPALESDRVLAADAAIRHLPMVSLNDADAVRIAKGQSITAQPGSPPGLVRLYAARSSRFIGLGEVDSGMLHPRRLLASPTLPV